MPENQSSDSTAPRPDSEIEIPDTPRPDSEVEISSPPPNSDGEPTSATLTRLEPVSEKKPASWWGTLVPGGRRQRQIQALQHGYVELLGSVNTMAGHLDQQVTTQQQMLELLSALPEASHELKTMSQLAGKQNEVLTLIRDQLQESGRQGKAVTGAIGEVHSSLKEMNESTQSSSRSLEALNEQSRGSDARLQDILQQSERRHSQLLMAIAALALLVVCAFYYRGTNGAPALLPPPPSERSTPTEEKPAAEPTTSTEALPAISALPGEKILEDPAPHLESTSNKTATIPAALAVEEISSEVLPLVEQAPDEDDLPVTLSPDAAAPSEQPPVLDAAGEAPASSTDPKSGDAAVPEDANAPEEAPVILEDDSRETI